MRNVKISSGNHREKRAKRKNTTPEQVQANNDRLSLRRLTAILNTNFCGNHIHAVLTYKNLPTEKEIKKDFDSFARKLRKELSATGEELRYVHVIECEHTRVHHHVVLSTSNADLIQKIWTKGYVKLAFLDSTGEYSKLAAYLLKETQKTFRTGENPYKKRYSTSKNITKPVIKREYVGIEELSEEPVPIRGYYIPKELNRRYEHPVTGLEHLEYTMVALGKPIEYKVWPFGEEVSGKEYYKADYIEEQLYL